MTSQRIWEFLLGLDKGFLSKEGRLEWHFNPDWPFQQWMNDHLGSGPAVWNLVLGLLALGLVAYVYTREGRSKAARISLGVMRLLVFGILIALLNRPEAKIVTNRTEESVVAVLMDDSISMKIDDVGKSRLAAMLDLVNGEKRQLVSNLAREHNLKFYVFDRGRSMIGAVDMVHPPKEGLATQPAAEVPEALVAAMGKMTPKGENTQIVNSIRNVLDDLQGQQVAGVILLTDGRDTPLETAGDLAKLKSYKTRIYAVPIGSEQAARNLEVDSLKVESVVFQGDLVLAQVAVRGAGYAAGHKATLRLVQRPASTATTRPATGPAAPPAPAAPTTAPADAADIPLKGVDGNDIVKELTINDDNMQNVELIFRPPVEGDMNVVAKLDIEQGEIERLDNEQLVQVTALKNSISVLYCDGYPRWEYRYLMREMMRDPSVDISCLLFSAESGFIQEGDKPITRFPETLKELLEYDCVVMGDVDPRQFTDRQLLLINEFVAQKGGGFGMIAGARWSPVAWRNTPIEALLPVSIDQAVQDAPGSSITSGFRPLITREGEASTVFRFFVDPEENKRFLKEEWQPVFWYARGLKTKAGAEVFAEHPTETGPDGKKAPILVMGKFGSGRTMFSAIDDSWRWRFYTGEQIFDTYWVQQLRLLSRERKMGQRRFTFHTLKPSYELNEQVQVTLQVRDPELLKQLSDLTSVDVLDNDGNLVRREKLVRQEGSPDTFIGNWVADVIGKYKVRAASLGGDSPRPVEFEVAAPRLELVQPQVNVAFMGELAAIGAEGDSEAAALNRPDLHKLRIEKAADLPVVRAELAKIPSAAKVVQREEVRKIWDAPVVMILFVLLITVEWVLRKVYGML